jgi:hypothetical protein
LAVSIGDGGVSCWPRTGISTSKPTWIKEVRSRAGARRIVKK